LGETARLGESPKTRDEAKIRTSEDLHKKLSHAKRRDLRVIRSSLFDSELVFDNTTKITDEQGVVAVFVRSFWSVEGAGGDSPIVLRRHPALFKKDPVFLRNTNTYCHGL
jgi:hypothetical protein